MSASLYYTMLLAISYLLLFGSAEWLYHRKKVEAEFTRKYVHVATGLIGLLFPILLDSHWLVLFLCASFLLILLASLKFNLLPSINGVKRTTRGSILYPVIVYGCYIAFEYFNNLSFYYIPILILAISDPMAALIGRKWPIKTYRTFGQQKSVGGSSAFFVSALVISFLLMQIDTNQDIQGQLLASLVISLSSTLMEAISHKGYDNLSIPASVLSVLIFFFH